MRRRRRSGGFTLIELLIALGLATVGLIGLMTLQTITVRGNMSSRQFIEALGIAQERIETAQILPYASLPTLSEALAPVATPTGNTTNSYQRQTTVAAGQFAGTTDVDVRVQWNDADGRSHAVTLRTTRSP